MRVLVTGASGFIGGRLVRRLLADELSVRALVLPDEAVALPPEVDVVRGDVTDAESVAAAARDCRRVYHLAAVVGDWGDERAFVRINVDGTRNVLDAAVAAGCERVLMVSSIVVYGWQMHTSVCDEDRRRELGVSPYSRTKRASEELALDYHAFDRVPVTVVRPGNVYGAGSRVWVDGVLEVVRAGRALLIDRGSGDAVLAHVDNVVEVIALAAANPEAAGRVYNANDGGGVSWRDYFADLAQLAGVAPPRRSVPSTIALGIAAGMERTWAALRRPTRPLLTREAVTLLASRAPVPIERAQRELGYHPPVHYDQAIAEIAEYLHAD